MADPEPFSLTANSVLHPKADSLLQWLDWRKNYSTYLSMYHDELRHRMLPFVHLAIAAATRSPTLPLHGLTGNARLEAARNHTAVDLDVEEKELKEHISKVRSELHELTAQNAVNKAWIDRASAHNVIRKTLNAQIALESDSPPTHSEYIPDPYCRKHATRHALPPPTNFHNLLRQRDAYAAQYLKLNNEFQALEEDTQKSKQNVAWSEAESEAQAEAQAKAQAEAQPAEQDQQMDVERDHNSKYEKALQLARARRMTVANVFVHLLMESGVDWAQDPQYRALLETSEGQWIDEVWEDVMKNAAAIERMQERDTPVTINQEGHNGSGVFVEGVEEMEMDP
ncbi:hypothetical protein HK097_004985 [Rhizophlyctis rosea]|uniref:Centromere protein H C-terminal domain-containing protein n=1 Tax=Rhizophlyctis rosea TaxID=64517 RepID=A0AAD5SEK3_9FUNG|nr:hypothetical protein HK097_004985 [Rhizophlyctis rosea]